jgi:hypothetical protein
MFKVSDILRDLNPMDRSRSMNTGDFLMWVDAVGGYWVCLGDQITLGQPEMGGKADVPILGDISNRHARVRRDGEGYLIEAYRPVYVDGRIVDKVRSLSDGQTIRLGDSVELIFRRPHALSATARLDFVSGHRTQPSVDAVLLMADACVLGPEPHCHVVCADWSTEVVLFRHDNRLFCRTAGRLEIDGHTTKGKGPITTNSRIEGREFSLTLEEL